MNRDMYKNKMQASIPAALFIALEGLYAAPVIAGAGVVVMQHELPTHAMTSQVMANQALANEGNSVTASASIQPSAPALAGAAMRSGAQ